MKLLRNLFGLFSALIVVSSALRVLGWVYGAVTPEPLPYSDRQRQAVQEASQDVQAWVSTLPLEHQTAAFGNLAHDPFGFASAPVRDAIWRSGRFDLAPRSFLERLRSRMGWTLPAWPAGQALVDYARSQGTDVAIGGSVLELSDGPKPSLGIHLEIVQVSTGHTLAAKDFLLRSSGAAQLTDSRLSSMLPAHLGLLLWIGMVLLLPLCLLPFAQELLIEGSNGAILFTLFGLVAFDVASAYLLYAGQFVGWPGTLLIVLLFAVSLALNFKYLTFLKEVSL